MTRLITFGCSLTYGQGLPDCNSTSSPPSQLGWPKILSDNLGKELVNISSPGASNLEILFNILNFKFIPTDEVVIMWSYAFRDLEFKRSFFNFKKIKFTPHKILLNKPWYKKQWLPTETLDDYIVKSWIYMHHADMYLKSKNIKFLHYPVCPTELDKLKIESIVLNNLCMDGIYSVDLADDNMHPGLKSNQLTADHIYSLCIK